MIREWTALPDGHALIGLGANLGARAATLDAAVTRLDGRSDCELLIRSTWIETAPVGGPPGQGQFLNGAALFKTSLDADEFLAVLHRIETDHGRVRIMADGPRTLDLDLLMFGTEVRPETETRTELVLPHPRMHLRDFVLVPVAEILPALAVPT